MQVNAMAAMELGAKLETFEYEIQSCKPVECIVRVLACGICYSDIHMIDNDWAVSSYPLVPGHEVIGEVVEVGSALSHLKVGDRVGVGWQRAACLTCGSCLRGDENLCAENEGVITHGYGGFADYMVVDGRFAFPLPEGLSSQTAGPLLCGGVTVYSALRNAGMTSGQRIGVIGIGGLGHLAVQFASKLGNHVTAFTTSNEKADEAARLGAHEACVSSKDDSPVDQCEPLDIILNTVAANLNWMDYINLLRPDGTLSFVGAPPDPVAIPIFPLLLKRGRIMASPIGGRAEIREMLKVADVFHVEPLTESFSIDHTNDAIEKVRANRVRYRAVLVP